VGHENAEIDSKFMIQNLHAFSPSFVIIIYRDNKVYNVSSKQVFLVTSEI